MRDIGDLFAVLGRSKFRRRFKLGGKEAQYLMEKGLATILEHARDFLMKRLADSYPANDGRQTPMSKHPVFIAQHATATCCRKCLAKWHNIPKGRPLREVEVDYIVRVIEHWLKSQDARVGASETTSSLSKV